MGLTLDGVPTWNQNSDPDPNGGADQFAATDCGWECCSMVIRFETGEYTTEGQLRKESPAHVGRGTTIGMDLVDCLARHGVQAVGLQIPVSELRGRVKGYIGAGNPCILLGRFVDPATLHWIVATGYGNDHILYNDPWDGRMRALRWKACYTLYAGTVVGVAGKQR